MHGTVNHATGARDVFHAMNLNERRSGDLQPRGDGNRCQEQNHSRVFHDA